MQNAKDSFYMALRQGWRRSIRSGRSCCAERCGRGFWWRRRKLPSASSPTMCLSCAGWVWAWIWILASTMVAEECEIVYQTCGTQSFGGLDRGRTLSEMDEELVAMLEPFYTPKLNYTATPPAAMLTKVFWDEPGFGPRL
jgi:hypothetical protein